MWIFVRGGVGAPKPCIVQGSTIFDCYETSCGDDNYYAESRHSHHSERESQLVYAHLDEATGHLGANR